MNKVPFYITLYKSLLARESKLLDMWFIANHHPKYASRYNVHQRNAINWMIERISMDIQEVLDRLTIYGVDSRSL